MLPSNHLLPITESDAELAELLAHANAPVLMMAMVHLSGDAALLDGAIKPKPPLAYGMQGGLDKSEREQIRQRALPLLAALRDKTLQPQALDRATIHRMMNTITGETVADEFVDMFCEEMLLDGKDRRLVAFEHTAPEDFHVVIIGAGMSGLLMAIRLQEQGIRFTMIEKNADVGGTWLDNSYPGCRVDVGNHFYSYSFEPNHDWNEFYSQRDELLGYFQHVADKYHLRQHIQFNTEVVAARYDEKNCRWEIEYSQNGKTVRLHANALVSAVGQLNVPKLPEISGAESFRGIAFHSARWNHDIDLHGKRVAVIGTGASAFQLIPKVAEQAAQVTVFQRTPCWMMPNPAYHKTVSEPIKWLMKHVPSYAAWYRFLLFWISADGIHSTLRKDPSWPHPERSVSAANDMTREFLTQYITQQLAERPDLLAKCIPSYPPYGKRMLQDNGSWLATLKRDNVALVTDKITAIDASGIITTDNSHAEIKHTGVDVIVYATGFRATEFLTPMKIIGKNSLSLNQLWADDPNAYLGITVNNFPNLFLLYGPGTNLAHAGSIIFHSECQVRYVMECLRTLFEGHYAALECKASTLTAWEEKHQQAMREMVWSHPGMNSWYKNKQGRVVTTSPWRLVDYWNMTRHIKAEDYEYGTIQNPSC